METEILIKTLEEKIEDLRVLLAVLRTKFKIREEPEPELDLTDFIVDLLSKGENVSKFEILGKSRKHNVVFVRQMCASLMKEFTGLSLEKIGKTFGYDHSVVLYSAERVEDMLSIKDKRVSNYERYREEIQNYRNYLQAKKERELRDVAETLRPRKLSNSNVDSTERTSVGD